MLVRGPVTEGGEGGAAAVGETAAASGEGAAKEAGEEAAGAEADLAGGETATAYEPNFKYKVLREEKEIPEWARPIVTSADAEKQVRDLFERADGIEAVKQHRDHLVAENAAMREHWAPTIQLAQNVTGYLQKKDYDSAFEALGIPEVEILKYVHQRLQLRDQPGALDSHEQARRARLENDNLQRQVQELTQNNQGQIVSQRERELDGVLARPESQPVVQAFDARVGKPGAFRAEVIRRGQLYAAQGQDISAEQAASEVLQLIGWQGQNPPSVSGQSGTGAAPGLAVGGGTPPSAKPTLPHIRGKGTSPAKRVPKSTDELRKLGRELAGR